MLITSSDADHVFLLFQDGLLNSDHRIKIASLPSPAMSQRAALQGQHPSPPITHEAGGVGGH